MPPTSLSAHSVPFVHPDGAGKANGLTEPHIQSCSDRLLQALADYNAILGEAFASMAAPDAANATIRLRHGMARAAAATAIEQLVACTPNSHAELSAKQAVLDASKAFCADNAWLDQLINASISRDLALLSQSRKSLPGWFSSVSMRSWPPLPRRKARAASDRA